MLRLTLRSSKDGHFLARVVDRGGFPFVLDFGDDKVIEDVGQRLRHGFTMWRHGRLYTTQPGDAGMLALLAEYYAGEGALVFLEEPNWPHRMPAPGQRATRGRLLTHVDPLDPDDLTEVG